MWKKKCLQLIAAAVAKKDTVVFIKISRLIYNNLQTVFFADIPPMQYLTEKRDERKARVNDNNNKNSIQIDTLRVYLRQTIHKTEIL